MAKISQILSTNQGKYIGYRLLAGENNYELVLKYDNKMELLAALKGTKNLIIQYVNPKYFDA